MDQTDGSKGIIIGNNGADGNNKLRFDVTRVLRREKEGGRTPRVPSTAESIISYGTHEAVPMTVFYRNDSARLEGKHTKKARPTLDQLRKGFEKNGTEPHIQPQPEQQPQVSINIPIIIQPPA